MFPYLKYCAKDTHSTSLRTRTLQISAGVDAYFPGFQDGLDVVDVAGDQAAHQLAQLAEVGQAGVQGARLVH